MAIEKIISADDHVQETPDLWERRLPAHFREKAPKIIQLENGAAAWGANPPRPLGLDVWAGRDLVQCSQPSAMIHSRKPGISRALLRAAGRVPRSRFSLRPKYGPSQKQLSFCRACH